MGAMKDFDRRIRQGGDDAIAAVEEYVAEQERLVAQVESMLQRACDRHWKEWIPVEERLPDRYIRVLAFVKCEPHEHAHAIGFVGSIGLWSLDELHEPSAVVTHWMPLPEPPKVK